MESNVRRIYKREWYNKNKHKHEGKVNIVIIVNEKGHFELHNCKTMADMREKAEEAYNNKNKQLLYVGRTGLGVHKFECCKSGSKDINK